MAIAHELLRLGDQSRQLYLFDTFEGMTAPGDEDYHYTGTPASVLKERHEKGGKVWNAVPLEEVRRAVLSTGYEAAQVHFVKGRVEDTLPQQAPNTIALLRLDTDWYESTKHELMTLFPRITPGGILIIDDYGHFAGARKAVDEYIRKYRVKILLDRADYSGRIGVVQP